MTTLEERIAEALCDEDNAPEGADADDYYMRLARAVVAVLPTADVSDAGVMEVLSAHEIGSNPRTCRYECQCGWQGTVAFNGRTEAEEHRAQAVRAALLDAQAAAHAADLAWWTQTAEGWKAATVEAQQQRDAAILVSQQAEAEVEALRESLDYANKGKAEVEALRAKVEVWGELIDDWKGRAEAARGVIAELTADRDAYRARIDAALALCDQWDNGAARDIRAALDGDA